MTNLLRIELDCFSDDCLDSEDNLDLDKMTRLTQACAAPHNVQATLVNPSGPGGGCPVYSFIGTKDAIKAYMKEHHHMGLAGTALDEEVEAMLEEFAEAV